MRIFVEGSNRAAVTRMFPIWEKMGHGVVTNPGAADVRLAVIAIRSNQNLPTVLRLDGVIYDKDVNYKSINTRMGNSHSASDAIIYQSHLSKAMCEKYLAKRRTKVYDVIYNGMAAAGWNRPLPHSNINVMSCAKWRRHKRLPETVEIFLEFLKYYPDAKLHIIGPMKRGAKQIPHKNIVYHGTIVFDKMINIYRTGDMHLHLSKKDSCPSSVVESIASGIPVITTNACGGSTEMCKLTEGCVVVGDESESLEPDYIYRDLYNKIPDGVKDGIIASMRNIAESKKRVVLPKELTIKYTAKQYIDVMNKIYNG